MKHMKYLIYILLSLMLANCASVEITRDVECTEPSEVFQQCTTYETRIPLPERVDTELYRGISSER